MEDITSIVIGISIVLSSFAILFKQKNLQREMEELSNDWDRNIDMSGYIGSGVTLKRKKYKTMENNYVRGAGIVEEKDKNENKKLKKQSIHYKQDKA